LVGAVVVLPAVYEARSLWLATFGTRVPVRNSLAPPER
jgi:hypothetical protein